MKKNVLLISLILCICGCKEDIPSSLPGNEYVNEFMSLDPGALFDAGGDLGNTIKTYLPWLEGYYEVSSKSEKWKYSTQIDAKIRQTLIFKDFDCSIRDIRDIKERAGFTNNEITTYRFTEASYMKYIKVSFENDYADVPFYIRKDGFYTKERLTEYPFVGENEKKILSFNGDFQIKYCSKKGTDVVYEDLTYTTDNTETFTYTQTGNEILMVNEEMQIKGVISSDYKTISLTQISPNTQEIGTFNYK